MKEFQGTPGPWTGKEVGVAKQDDAGLQLGFVMTIDEKRRDECGANAYLIAAAPELLEALIKLVDIVDDMTHGPSTDAAHAAISKALGE